ncbi:F0F1 ATP synthase subunit B [Enterococcus canintestini]|uniref:ATP synthase subunit b n=1 Tax=Enterococcus canintestini TaxID=317010 RepID=A0A1L8R2S0_9ENTE|nr:F0F1 ATP synthase subunit B [Enterococcus canintestini]OJG14063.1 ATP synthase subunit B [Enterococcus canintestini]
MLNIVLAEVGNTTISSIVVVSGSFLLLVVLLKHFAWGAISDMMKKREDKIANDLDSAEQSRTKAAKLEQERQAQLMSSKSEAAEIIKNAKDSGELSRQNILNETKEEVSRLKDKAKSDISMERDAAMTSVKGDVAELSLQIAEKILNKELSPEAHEALINQYIEGLGSNETR